MFKASAAAFALYAGKLDRSSKAWKPTASDAFTAVVVMVPTMSEYFGQWKVSRFVLGDRAKGDSFNVVSRLSDIGDILGGLRVIYAGHPAGDRHGRRRAGGADEARARQPVGLRLASCGRRSDPDAASRREQADSLGRTAQGRATAIAGQVTQAAARLKVKIAQ